MDKMSQEEQNDLMAKEDKIYNLRELYDTTLNDNNVRSVVTNHESRGYATCERG